VTISGGIFRFFDTLGNADDPSLVFLEDFIEGIEKESWRVHEGTSLGPLVPPDPKISLRKENAGIKLASLIGNTRHMLVVSRAFKEVIESVCGTTAEYIGISLIDHRKRVLTKDYFIVNPIGAVDCLDIARSDIVWSDDTPPELLRFNEHVLDRSKLTEAAPALFRMKEHSSIYVAGPRLEAAMRAHQPKFTNIRWTRLRYADEL
jgi:hypothetical protein